MELHTLTYAKGSKKTKKRIGRGEGMKKGGTATKGHKGAQSRSGYKTRPYRQSGTTPLQRSKPKFGVKNPNRRNIQPINLDRLDAMAIKYKLTKITPQLLVKYGIIKKKQEYKILAKGELTRKLHIQSQLFSESAQKCIEKVGGSITTI